MKLSHRLATIANLVNTNDIVADIACDHGLVSIYLVKKKGMNNIFVSDINPKALAQAQKNIIRNQLQNNIFPILGDGIKWINASDNINCVIIAGLGAKTIINILTNDYQSINRYIIQTNNEMSKIRKWAQDHNYFIEDELLIKDNNFIYEIIVINKTHGCLIVSDEQIMFGLNLENKYELLFKKMWTDKIFHYENIINKLTPNQINAIMNLQVLLIRNKLQKQKKK
ncbi:tRNA (adenine(22)-N(1))-methyltransferase [Spiroplasma endosymbiont of 'Nebria riversi']|uniref:tRNA (adenine(22)-N(1))-methyltransferase n=1 Tax=Spiroplasma endosymbiont of 'Nebria riversi' TaxID=2792084 RepID=UPI001C048964|nr:class I SAM-dependent methyltransferase [Spiroplasma endosymbiont of 'Nebria riversi']